MRGLFCLHADVRFRRILLRMIAAGLPPRKNVAGEPRRATPSAVTMPG